MSTLGIPVRRHSSLAHLHAAFVSILPTLQGIARFSFRRFKRHHDKENAIAETIALCWAWFRRLAEKGRDATQFKTALGKYAARFVKSGRHLNGSEHSKDVLSARAQKMRGFGVEQFPLQGDYDDPSWQLALHDNHRTPVPEAAAFRIDFPEWLGTYDHRNRRIIEKMTGGERTLDLSSKFGISPGRVSQLRREYQQDWQRFHGEQDRDDPTTLALRTARLRQGFQVEQTLTAA